MSYFACKALIFFIFGASPSIASVVKAFWCSGQCCRQSVSMPSYVNSLKMVFLLMLALFPHKVNKSNE